MSFPSCHLSELLWLNPSVKYENLSANDVISFVPMEVVDELNGLIAEQRTTTVSRTKGFTKFQENDLLWAKITPCMQNGKSAIARNLVNGYGCGSTEFYVLRPKTDNVLIEYIHFLLRDKRVLESAKNSFGGSAGQQRVSSGYLKSIQIPLPPMNIQQQIVNLYNAVAGEKQAKEREAQDLLAGVDDYLLKELGIELPENVLNERYFEVNILDLIGGRFDTFYNNPIYSGIDEKISSGQYPFKKFKEICYAVSGVVYSSGDESEKGKAILRGNNITLETNEINYDSIRYISDSFIIPDNLKLQKDDILMSSASGSKEHVGKVAFIEKDMDYYFGGFMTVLRRREKDYNQKYFFAFLQSKLFRSYLYRNLGGTNINNLNFNMLANLKIPFPPIEKQNEIAQHIQSIRTKAKQLKAEAVNVLEKAKREIEGIVTGRPSNGVVG